MLPYVPAGLRSPVASREQTRGPALGGPSLAPRLGQTFDDMLGMTPACGDVLRLLGHSGGAWVGIHTGLYQTGALRWVGWVIGSGMAIAGFLDVVSLFKRAVGTHPPEEGTIPERSLP